MTKPIQSADSESHALIICSKATLNAQDIVEIRHFLAQGMDWTRFAEEAVTNGLTNVVAVTLTQVAADALPGEILAAFREIIERNQRANRSLLGDLGQLLERESPGRRKELFTTALTQAIESLTPNPCDFEAWRRLGEVLGRQGRKHETVACIKRAVTIAPNNAENLRELSAAMLAVGRNEKALAHADAALKLNSRDARSWMLRASSLNEMQFYAEAVEASNRALELDANNVRAARVRVHAQLFTCDWKHRKAMLATVAQSLRAGKAIITPFNHLALSNSEAENFRLAQIWAKGTPANNPPLWSGELYRHERARIAYLSTDFRDTLSVNAIGGCFEAHSSLQFETTAISLGPNDKSSTRRRIEAAFDHFIDAQELSDAEIAQKLREAEIDVIIDLNAYSGARRTGIIARRPAPVQVNYLGYAGTTAMPFFDYIIADKVVLPEENKRYYSEKVVYLPNSFFPLDRNRQISTHTPTRAEAGLPESGFVFTCQNTAYKITPEVFDIWMSLLHKVEGSVLWLASSVPDAIQALRREALARGIKPERVRFCPKVAKREDHLARLRLADLFLDTMPYNAHTTASDALWAGVPLVTCLGKTFPARVAASLLTAAGLPELITQSLDEYAALALKIATDPLRLAAIKSKLARNRDTEPLFDTTIFTRHLEAAFATMWKRQQAGLPPQDFTVAT